MKHVHTEMHTVTVTEEGYPIICHAGCPTQPSWPEGESCPACFVWAVAEDCDGPGEGVWAAVDGLAVGVHVLRTEVVTYRGREDDPVVTYTVGRDQ